MRQEELIKILDYLSIPHVFVTHNAVNVDCPFCADDGKHCGVFVSNLRFHCWKCKAKGSFYSLLNQLLGISRSAYEDLFEAYALTSDQKTAIEQIEELMLPSDSEQDAKQPRSVVWPPEGSVQLSVFLHDSVVNWFLAKRKLNPQVCIEKGLYVGVAGRYMNRLIIPVLFQGKVVAYQARDMLGTHKAKYLTEGDVSNFLYGIDEVDPAKPVYIAEGIFSSWATGDNAVASFGTNLSTKQTQLLCALNPPAIILCWDIGREGGDAFWIGRKKTQELATLFGPGRVGYVELPEGHDPDSLGREKMSELRKNPVLC